MLSSGVSAKRRGKDGEKREGAQELSEVMDRVCSPDSLTSCSRSKSLAEQ